MILGYSRLGSMSNAIRSGQDTSLNVKISRQRIRYPPGEIIMLLTWQELALDSRVTPRLPVKCMLCPVGMTYLILGRAARKARETGNGSLDLAPS